MPSGPCPKAESLPTVHSNFGARAHPPLQAKSKGRRRRRQRLAPQKINHGQSMLQLCYRASFWRDGDQ